MRPKEDLIHYIWRTKSFDHKDLKTSAGEDLEIITYGSYNRHDGPDFLNATIKIGRVQWAGHIEMHVNSSDWVKHGHDSQTTYDNVILHIVLHNDQATTRPDGEKIPTLVLSDRVSQTMLNKYHHLMHTRSWIPCAERIHEVADITKSMMMSRSVADRLEKKADDIIDLYNQNNNDLRSVVYQRIAWTLGLSVNAEPMLRLTQITPLHLIDKHRDNLLQVEAMLFGQSGLLPAETDDDYINQLKREYQFLQKKFKLDNAMRAIEWKFMRIRPAGFPTVRIAQLAKLLSETRRLDTLIFEEDTKMILEALDVSIDGYWSTHYSFGEESVKRKKSIGSGRKQLIIINAIAPLLFAYGTLKTSQDHKDKAIELLENTTAEKNNIISKWKTLGIACSNGADSQALLHLKKHYCDQFRCLECSIGHQLIKNP